MSYNGETIEKSFVRTFCIVFCVTMQPIEIYCKSLPSCQYYCTGTVTTVVIVMGFHSVRLHFAKEDHVR